MDVLGRHDPRLPQIDYDARRARSTTLMLQAARRRGCCARARRSATAACLSRFARWRSTRAPRARNRSACRVDDPGNGRTARVGTSRSALREAGGFVFEVARGRRRSVRRLCRRRRRRARNRRDDRSAGACRRRRSVRFARLPICGRHRCARCIREQAHRRARVSGHELRRRDAAAAARLRRRRGTRALVARDALAAVRRLRACRAASRTKIAFARARSRRTTG